MRVFDKKTQRLLARLLGGRPRDEMDANAVMGLMLQISLKLLIVFIIAYFFYKDRVGMTIERAKMVPVQQQKQMLAAILERIETRLRDHLGLRVFVRTDTDGRAAFNLDGVLAGGTITDNPLVREQFLAACAAAKETLPFAAAMEAALFSNVLVDAGVTTVALRRHAGPDIGVLRLEHETWLRQDVSTRVKALYSDAVALQRALVARLQQYYCAHPDTLTDPAIRQLLKEYRTAPPDKQAALVRQLSDALYQHAKSTLEAQGVPLLHNI